MALARYVVTSLVTVPAGTETGGNFGTASFAGAAGAWADGDAVTFGPGTVIELDNASGGGLALYNAIGAGNLRPYVQGQDDVGHSGLGN